MGISDRIGGDWLGEAIARMHQQRTRIGYFVDRDYEARRVLGWDVRIVEGGMITVLYGPKGCGKTTFFEVLHIASRSFRWFEVIIVSSEEEAWKAEKLYVSESLRGAVKKVLGRLEADIEIGGEISGVVNAAKLVSMFSAYIASRLRKGRKILIVLDEVKADSQEHAASFRNWLENFANIVSRDDMSYSQRGGNIAVIALTSDAIVSEIRGKVGGKVKWVVMWNLPRTAADEILDQTGLHHRVAGELSQIIGIDIGTNRAKDILWRLAGGNPRSLSLILGMGISSWLSREIIGIIDRELNEASKEIGWGRVWSDIKEIIYEIDHMRGLKLFNFLLRSNIVIDIGMAEHLSEISKEEWIGRDYAYQIPAYYYTLKAMAKKKSTRISVKEVIEEAITI
jgi:energy-coupling factor transporter ATP-binding protein EcfA2